jgi:hypothetical protein
VDDPDWTARFLRWLRTRANMRSAALVGRVERGSSTGLVFTVVVDRQRLRSIAHSHHPIAAPIFGVNVNRLLRRADRQPAARILDLGCGEAAWALQALAHYPDGHADGVDVGRYAMVDSAGRWSWPVGT